MTSFSGISRVCCWYALRARATKLSFIIIVRKIAVFFFDDDMDDSIVNLKLQGPEGLVKKVVKLLEERVAAVPTGSVRENDKDSGVHCYLIIREQDLEALAQ